MTRGQGTTRRQRSATVTGASKKAQGHKCPLDSPVDAAFDRLNRLIAHSLGVPIAYVLVVDGSQLLLGAGIGVLPPLAAHGEMSLNCSLARQAIEAGEPISIEDTGRHPLSDSSLEITELRLGAYLCVPVTGADGTSVGALCAADMEPRRWTATDLDLLRDIAAVANSEIERRHAIAEAERIRHDLDDLRTRLQQVITAFPEGVVVSDAAGRIRHFNPKFRAILGRDPAEIDANQYGTIGYRRPNGEPFPPEELPLARSVMRGETVSAEEVLMPSAVSGELVPLLISSAPVRNADGAIIGGVAICQEIGVRKAQEWQKGEFIASVAHDLKNPVATIRGFAALSRRLVSSETTALSRRLQDSLANVERSAIKVAAVVDDLLDLARLELGQPLHLTPRRFDLVALARSIVEEFQQLTSAHRLRVETSETHLFGVWDPIRLERVLTNLLGNAIKYSPGGEIVLEIGRVDEKSANWAVVRVIDRGVGIPPSEIDHIFERFYRASNAPKQLQGVGIGLTSAHQCIDEHGGTISVQSQVGVGSAFTIRLPLPLER